MAEGPILVVDDDAAIRETISEALNLEGFAVATARNGLEALRFVEGVTPRLVLLDMRMPQLDGWGFARAVRERGQELPIVVMTAARDARRWAEEVGARGYLAKPFELAELLQTVQRFTPHSGG